jgi:hypothetical protein
VFVKRGILEACFAESTCTSKKALETLTTLVESLTAFYVRVLVFFHMLGFHL